MHTGKALYISSSKPWLFTPECARIPRSSLFQWVHQHSPRYVTGHYKVASTGTFFEFYNLVHPPDLSILTTNAILHPCCLLSPLAHFSLSHQYLPTSSSQGPVWSGVCFSSFITCSSHWTLSTVAAFWFFEQTNSFLLSMCYSLCIQFSSYG